MLKRSYSLVEIAERLRRPRTTLADWSRQFREFLPTVGSGRSLRYTEEAIEVFGLISKMKDSNEPPEYIREHLRGVVTEIVVPMTDDDGGTPYLVQLASEVDQLKRAVVLLAERMEMLMTDHDGARRELAATTEQLNSRLAEVSNTLQEELRKGQEDTRQQLGEILTRVETHGKRKRWWPFG